MNKKVRFGFSVYVSSYEQQKPFLQQIESEDVYIFTSLHIMEEAEDKTSYKQSIIDMLNELKAFGFNIIADISQRTLELFGCKTMVELKNTLDIDVIRVDYGFTQEQIQEAMEEIDIAVNASTLKPDMMAALSKAGKKPLAIHNYYPRQETGLECSFFQGKNQQLRLCGYDIAMFIAGDNARRGPIFDGLPTLEHQRNIAPYVSFIEAANQYSMDLVLLGDLNMDMTQIQWIMDYIHHGIISVPIHLESQYTKLYDKEYTIREDSGAYAFRFLESREYSTNSGMKIEQDNCIKREQGALTIDNHLYKRYSGEIQLVYKALEADHRVNVIGQLDDAYIRLVGMIQRGDRLRLVRRK
ncbi:MupG family TIM beta-alpha barrel fold protein [Vallitaleaceae bacterium 9-2]